jgi:hypothetical protein
MYVEGVMNINPFLLGGREHPVVAYKVKPKKWIYTMTLFVFNLPLNLMKFSSLQQ